MNGATGLKGSLGGMASPEEIVGDGIGGMGTGLAAGLLFKPTVRAIRTILPIRSRRSTAQGQGAVAFRETSVVSALIAAASSTTVERARP